MMDDIRITDLSEREDENPVSAVSAQSASEMVKVRFSKFVQLVATHDFEDVLKKYGDENIVVSGNLLTDLASAHEDVEARDNRKLPIMLLTGIVIGIIMTYLLIRY